MQPDETDTSSADERSSPDGGADEQMEQLNERMDRIEQKLDRLTGLLDRAPDVAATVGDVADDYARQAADSGADVDERVNALGPLVMKLTDPEVLETLHGLVERADQIDRTVELLDSLEGSAAMVGDMFDSYAMQLDEQGAGVDERLRGLGNLAMRATEPEVLETLQLVVDRSDSLREAVEMVDQMPEAVATVVDSVDDWIMEASEHGIDVVQVTGQMAEAAEKLADFIQGEEFTQLMRSGVLDPEAVRVIGTVARAATEASRDEPDTSGFFDLFRALRRSNVKRAVNFGVRLGEHFGDLLVSEEEVGKSDNRLGREEPSALPGE